MRERARRFGAERSRTGMAAFASFARARSLRIAPARSLWIAYAPSVWIACALVLGATARAQSGDVAYVASRMPGAPGGRATVLTAVDLRSGSALDLGRFASDVLEPSAVAWDPVRRELVLALRGRQTTDLVRLAVDGGRARNERLVARLPGVVRSIDVGWEGDLFVTTAAGLWRCERLGGGQSLDWPAPGATHVDSAIGLPYVLFTQARDRSTGQEPGLSWYDATSGGLILGPFLFPSAPGDELTGHLDLATGLQRDLFTDELGNVLLSVNFGPPQVLGLQPVLPPGSTVAMRSRGNGSLEPLVLGGSADPRLKTFDPLQAAPTWSFLSGALPGDPVDFAVAPAPGGGETIAFGRSCAPAGSLSANGAPDLGNASFALELLGGAASTPYFLGVGLDDQRFFGILLPFEFLPGCELAIAAELWLTTPSSPLGRAVWNLPVPRDPALVGTRLFAQALASAPAPHSTNALVIHPR